MKKSTIFTLQLNMAQLFLGDTAGNEGQGVILENRVVEGAHRPLLENNQNFLSCQMLNS